MYGQCLEPLQRQKGTQVTLCLSVTELTLSHCGKYRHNKEIKIHGYVLILCRVDRIVPATIRNLIALLT